MYGTGSDPRKSADLREVLRLRSGWLEDGSLELGSTEDLALLEELIPAPEHNWGLSTSAYLRSWDTYAPAELATARTDRDPYRAVDTEWATKRRRPREAVAVLPGPLASQAAAVLDAMHAPFPDVEDAEESLEAANDLVSLRIDPATGALSSLVDLRTGRQWASPDGTSVFSYVGYDVDDYARYSATYNHSAFAANDFGKPGLDRYGARHVDRVAPAAAARRWQDGVFAELSAPEGADDPLTAWPGRVAVSYLPVPGEAAVDVRVWISDKTPNRRPRPSGSRSRSQAPGGTAGPWTRSANPSIPTTSSKTAEGTCTASGAASRTPTVRAGWRSTPSTPTSSRPAPEACSSSTGTASRWREACTSRSTTTCGERHFPSGTAETCSSASASRSRPLTGRPHDATAGRASGARDGRYPRIGAAIAVALSHEGAEVIVHGRGDASGRRFADEHGFTFLAADLADLRGIDAFASAVLGRFPALDILVNNAGMEILTTVGNLDPAAVATQLKVDLEAPILLTNRLVPALRKGVSPSVINISSIHGRSPHGRTRSTARRRRASSSSPGPSPSSSAPSGSGPMSWHPAPSRPR
ncbi:SDR family NAD(P)-dependent oxidoreductase [Tessaracoccus sp. HDW20]|uniref:SDR family NAD(P)-dependent oxidoreductase n=1 Tax=Tessaracoccus coleopterorum TaxID=2714950 RepID=UPI0018D384FC|nr:SDR family NAD(P)-dependent oxidoreductase [Tessaracoccus coleopterorum]NHB85991.1 SDR family NAD(P)-dependent oxidoreductase [Tessaracoccus coleopterorum]